MKKLNDNLIGLGLLYLIIPIVIFIFGYLNIITSLLFFSVLIICSYKFIKLEKNNINKYDKKISYLVITLIIISIWLLFSGIGNFSYQNTDYHVRNAVLRDLINYKWPVIFDFNNTSSIIKESFGLESNSAFIYYFTYWLPSALVGKIFNLKIANIFLYIWSFIGLLLIIGLINNYCKKQSKFTILLLILFGGLDVLIYINKPFSFIFGIKHIERWAAYLQYSSNTTLLYWVFNQAIPTWLITCLLLNIKKASSTLFVSSLIFVYSPFATFGMVPIAIYLVVTRLINEYKEKKIKLKEFIIKNSINIEIIWVLLELIIFGSFYLSANSSISFKGIVWHINGITATYFLVLYISFILTEIFLYIVIDYKYYKDDKLFWLVVIELLLIPIYQITPANDFCMRGSMVPLFILSIFTTNCLTSNFDLKGILKEKDNKIKYKKIRYVFVITMFLLIASITSLHEINRSIYYTLINKQEDLIKDDQIYSIGNPITEDGADVCSQQFYSRNYEDKMFFKYFARK